jgi:hypothetical protein
VADAATVALMKTQSQLDKLADRIEAAKVESADAGVSGFFVDAKRNVLRVYWKGAVSSAATKEIDQARARGITVNVQAAPYTQAQLNAEVTRLTRLNMTSSGSGTRLVSVGPKPDGSGIELGVSGLPAGADHAYALTALPALASSIATDIAAMAAPEVADRYIDFSPYYGGDYIERRVNNVPQNACSSGFAAQSGGLHFMLTAAHCGTGDWFTGGGGDPRSGNYIGAGTAQDHDHDATLIVTDSTPLMWDGGSIWGERPQFTKTVHGVSSNRDGDFVCASGSFSGAVCNILVTQTGLAIDFNGYGTVFDLVRADRQDSPRQAASGNGDSGGPMFSLDGDSAVIARGTITGMPSDPSLQDPCIGVPGGDPADPNARHCSHRIYYPDIVAQTRTLQFSVMIT